MKRSNWTLTHLERVHISEYIYQSRARVSLGNNANKVTVPSMWLSRVDYITGLNVRRLYQQAGTDPQDLNLGRDFHFSHHL